MTRSGHRRERPSLLSIALLGETISPERLWMYGFCLPDDDDMCEVACVMLVKRRLSISYRREDLQPIISDLVRLDHVTFKRCVATLERVEAEGHILVSVSREWLLRRRKVQRRVLIQVNTTFCHSLVLLGVGVQRVARGQWGNQGVSTGETDPRGCNDVVVILKGCADEPSSS
jgi:hypothetical protein